ncbi:MAG: anthranilate synthase component I [Armatimonadetes bacterium]|nr:anthranilate synthase component I [Armatimonadota bacterium]
MLYPTRDEFVAKASQGNLIPVWREVLADMETPVSAFRKIAQGRPNSFLLESVEGGERLARYSFLGSDPFLIFRSKGDTATVTEGGHTETIPLAFGERDPLHVLASLLGRYTYVPTPELPRFVGGAVGMIGYDTVRFFEKLPTLATDDLQLDDCLFLFTDALLVFDHVKHKMLALCNARIAPGQDPGAAYDGAVAKIDALLGRLKETPVGAQHAASLRKRGASDFTPNRTEEDYKAAVLKAKEYIAAGDTFQAQIGQRLSKTLYADPFDVYRALRSINPSPYMFYLDFGETKLVGASPEVLVSEQNRVVTIRPIAGSRHGRGATPEEDDAIAADLLADEKERAEHIMLVDLARNDIGRVAKYGTVKVDELMVIEKYSHVMHIVSEVTGILRDDLDQFDVLRASFPAGTLTGAPKVRTMEIIEELEPTRRGHYGGGIGYFSFSGDMDSAITIRTALVKGDTIYLQAAGGVVADSVPEYEYRETLAKMRALVRAVEWAESGLE